MSVVEIIGSGGREYSIGEAILQGNPEASLVFIPGNGGTEELGKNLNISAEDIERIARETSHIDPELVIIGPEGPLSHGLADRLQEAGVQVFGPSKAAAEIESSKAFAKAFMTRHGIPTAAFATFGNFAEAVQHVRSVKYPVVIKASGLASGKGVELPDGVDAAVDALDRFMNHDEHQAAGHEVVIEERLTGEEVSLLAFTDGITVRPMPPAQDHKRLRDGDQGPNTGGMGAYAPAPVCPPEMVEKLQRTILQPTVDGLRAEGRPFVGVLYAGLMLTPNGPYVIEFNCRFGDPEAPAILPLLDSEQGTLLDITRASAEGKLDQIKIGWKEGFCACVVLASGAYPKSSLVRHEITGLDIASHMPHVHVNHAGTLMENGKLVTNGGRIMAVTGWGESLEEALKRAYAAVEEIKFEGKQYRKDIGWRALVQM